MRPTHSRSRLAVALLTALALALPGASGPLAQTPAGGALVIGLDQEPPTLDPHASPSAVTYQIIASVTESLLYKAVDGTLTPWLAESWTTAADGRSVTFKLRRDVKFHDGTPFNADAVKANLDRIVDPKFKPGSSRAQIAGYAGAKVLDEFTVQVTFETPFAPFLTYAAAGTLSFVSPKAFREMGDQVHTRPIGTGAFMIKDYVAKDHTTMVRNPAYTRKAPWSERTGPALLESVVWKFIPEAGTRVTTLESGETQGIFLVPAQALPRLEQNTAAYRVDKTAVAGRAPHLAPEHDQAADGRRQGPPRDQPRRGQGGVSRHRLPRHRPKGVRAAHRPHAGRPRAASGLSLRSQPGEGLARRSGLATRRRRHPDEGRAAAGDRPERDRVRRGRRPHGAAHPVVPARRRRST